MCEGVLRFFEDVDRKSRNPAARLVSRHLIKGDPLGMFVEQYRDRVRQAIDDYRAEGTDVLTWGAPAAIVIATRRSATTPVEDAAMASQNILLAAHAMGYATCMVGFAVTAMARDREIQRAVGIPMNERVRAVIAVGKTATRYQRVTGRSAATVRVVP
jgi:nitroreductase